MALTSQTKDSQKILEEQNSGNLEVHLWLSGQEKILKAQAEFYDTKI